MTTFTPYPARVEFSNASAVARWRPLVQWVLAIPHLMVAEALSSLRQVLILISLFTVLFTESIPRSIFDAITMTYRYEWRAMSYALSLHDDYPPFDFTVSADDDGVEPHARLTIAYPEHLDRWKPLYKWFLAIPHFVVMVALAIAGFFAFLAGIITALVTGNYPQGIRDFLVGAYRYGIRVQAYAGLLTDEYPPFRLSE